MRMRGEIMGSVTITRLMAVGFMCLLTAGAWGQTAVSSDLLLTPLSPTDNLVDTTITLTIEGLGANADTQQITLSGNILADLQINNHPVTPTIRALSITGGLIAFSDADFLLSGDTLPFANPVTTRDQSGTPGTLTPPSQVAVPTGQFVAEDHFITLDSGMISITLPPPFGLLTIDLSQPVNQVQVVPMGTGVVSMTSAGPPVGGLAQWDVHLTLPVVTSEIAADDGTASVKIENTGQLTAVARVQLLDLTPYPAGDANLDGMVTVIDFAELQNHFDQPGEWFDGDFNGDGRVTLADFAILQNNISGDGAQAAALQAFAATLVPEPLTVSSLSLLLLVIMAIGSGRGANRD